MTGSRTELYVYYRVAPANEHSALQAVRVFQSRLCSDEPGLIARVLRRADERSDSVTLMETYAFDDGTQRGVAPALQALIESAAAVLTPWLIGARQIERFDVLDGSL